MTGPMQDTGISWVGPIPSVWGLAPNKTFMTLIKNKVGERANDYPMLSLTKKGVIVRDVKSGKGKFSASNEGYQLLEPGNIVFCLFDIEETPRTVGLVKTTGIITNAYSAFAINTSIADVKYVTYFYESVDDRKLLKSLYSGLRNTIRPPRFLEVKMPLPPLSTQRRIAAFLDERTANIDALVAELTEFSETLKLQRKALISECVTRGVPGERNREMKDSGVEWLGEIPAGWRVANFKHLFKFCKETNASPNPIVLSLGMSGIKIRDISGNKGQIAESYENYSLIRPGQFALNPMDLISGAVAISPYEGVLSNAYKIFTHVGSHYESEMNARFYEYVLRWHYENKIFLPFGKGVGRSETGGGRWTLNTETLKNFPMSLPTAAEQNDIVCYLDEQCSKIDELLSEINTQIDLLLQYRKSLISEAVTGKIDI